MSHRKPQLEEKHPPGWRDILNPTHLAGQNIGADTIENDPGARHARDFKRIGELCPDFTDAELREIPIVPVGHRLDNDATYVDLCDPARRPFKATGRMAAAQGTMLVPKAEVPYQYWNRLVGRRGAERTEIDD